MRGYCLSVLDAASETFFSLSLRRPLHKRALIGAEDYPVAIARRDSVILDSDRGSMDCRPRALLSGMFGATRCLPVSSVLQGLLLALSMQEATCGHPAARDGGASKRCREQARWVRLSISGGR